ncbi:hypothetical protein BDZ91DRAFT_762483 [Kalaharituber pfeilii]|nr:hypothetical protein BDZ91DRAFT_762483 [Kalaharituber pfeilii]
MLHDLRRLGFFQFTFFLIIIFLVASTLCLPSLAYDTSPRVKTAPSQNEERFRFLKQHWIKATGGQQKRGLGANGWRSGAQRNERAVKQKSARSAPLQVSTSIPSGHTTHRGTVALIVGVVSLILAGLMG